MAWLAVNKDGTEAIYNIKPFRATYKTNPIIEMWALPSIGAHYIDLPKGLIKKLIGKDLTWNDEPVKI